MNKSIKILIKSFQKDILNELIKFLLLIFGFTGLFFISLYIYDELTWESCHENYDNIYRVNKIIKNNQNEVELLTSPYPLGPAMKNDFPEVKNFARIEIRRFVSLKYKDEVFHENQVGFTDSTIFDIFTIPLIEGNKKDVLSKPYSLIMRKDVAKKYFKDQDPIGKTLTLTLFDRNYEYTVTGILGEIPHNTDFKYDVIATNNIRESQNWNLHPCNTYILTQPNIDKQSFKTKISEWFNSKTDMETELNIEKIRDIRLYSNVQFLSKIGQIRILIICSILLVITIAVNYISLFMLKYNKGTKRIGIQKILGITKSDLVLSFIIDSIIYTAIITFISVLLILILYPTFNNLFNKEFELVDMFLYFIYLFSGTLVIGVITSIYPAFYLSAIKSSVLLKGFRLNQGKKMRNVFITLQILFATTSIIVTIFVLKQYNLLVKSDYGFRKDNVIAVKFQRIPEDKYEFFKSQFLKINGISSVAASSSSAPYLIFAPAFNISWPEKDPDTDFNMNFDHVSSEYLSTFEVDIIEGQDFNDDIYRKGNYYLINKEAKKVMNLSDPIGKYISVFGTEGEIVGVFENFVHQPMSTFTESPLILSTRGQLLRWMFFSITPGSDITQIIDEIQNTFNNLTPNEPFSYFFIDQTLKDFYFNEEEMKNAFILLSLIIIMTSIFGLFSLCLFMAQIRTKEIGIRKAIGAYAPNIITLILKYYTPFIIISFILSVFISYFFLKTWLNNYSNRVEINAIGILLPLIAIAIFIYIIIGTIAIKVAITNPVEVLKNEDN